MEHFSREKEELFLAVNSQRKSSCGIVTGDSDVDDKALDNFPTASAGTSFFWLLTKDQGRDTSRGHCRSSWPKCGARLEKCPRVGECRVD